MTIKSDSLDIRLVQTEVLEAHQEKDLKRLLLENQKDRIRQDHCVIQNPQEGIRNLRVKQNGQMGYHGCSVTVNGNKHSCRVLGTSMTNFGVYNLFICEYKQPN